MPGTMHRASSKAELVRLKAELKTAREGLSLLERKRDTLMNEAMNRLRQAKALRLELTRQWQPLWQQWCDTLTRERSQNLQRLASRLEPPVPPRDASRHWMSVLLAELSQELPVLAPLGSVTQVGLRPEQVRGTLAALLPRMVELMALETSVRRIAQALKRCHRQVNALDRMIIPELVREQTRVEQRLEEKEREAIFQIKRLKARMP